MERIKSLIEKLNTQVLQNAPLSQLLVTVQMLQNEIAGSMKETEVLGTSGVSVFVPNVKPLDAEERGRAETGEPGEKEYFELIMDASDEDDAGEEVSRNIPSYEELVRLQEEINARTTTPLIDEEKDISVANQYRRWTGEMDIDPNDRIIFVRELFRGDEIMFERSIRTINNFDKLEEAEYWIQRELKTKNGWQQGDRVVSRFEQLIKQRFE